MLDFLNCISGEGKQWKYMREILPQVKDARTIERKMGKRASVPATTSSALENAPNAPHAKDETSNPLRKTPQLSPAPVPYPRLHLSLSNFPNSAWRCPN
ncbi:hypothetical protein C5167_002216 [Papaver somniferum]|uniref:Uncharacterized protein n=1 Tax=Papaver somniferum TaxID=3469 RepID=A0A4Y7L106_PAPSO|nr:hypothetical protein C5167_002216 [Papaver somniferum]